MHHMVCICLAFPEILLRQRKGEREERRERERERERERVGKGTERRRKYEQKMNHVTMCNNHFFTEQD